MSAAQIAQRAREINDQNRRMTGLVVAEAIGIITALIITGIFIS